MNWTNTRNEGGVWKLHDEVSSAAFESMEALWSAFLEAGDLWIWFALRRRPCGSWRAMATIPAL